MKVFLGCIVGAQVLQHVVNRIFKASAGFVGGFYALGDKLANFKTIHTLRKSAVNLVGTHGELRHTGFGALRGELVRSGRTAGAEQAGLFQMRVCFHCTLETP